MRYFKYLAYVIRHRWFVMLECFQYGLLWQGLVHDLDKFLPDEFIPYARFFHNPDGSKRQIRDKTGYYKPDDTGDPAFDFAWFLHQARNPHHWQYWILPKDDGTIKPVCMPRRYVLEMLCDWRGAGRAQGTPNTQAWYAKNKDKLILHPTTRQLVEENL